MRLMKWDLREGERLMSLMRLEWLMTDDELDEVCEAKDISEVRQADE